MPHYIASVSWGKDSLAMLHLLIDSEWPLDEVLFFDTGMEFEAIYAERDRMLPELEALGIDLDEAAMRKVTERVVELSDKKEQVTAEDLPYILSLIHISEPTRPY